MSGFPSSTVWDNFLSFLTGGFLLLLLHMGAFSTVLPGLGLRGILVTILTFLIGLFGLLAVILSAFFIFRKVWRSWFKK